MPDFPNEERAGAAATAAPPPLPPLPTADLTSLPPHNGPAAAADDVAGVASAAEPTSEEVEGAPAAEDDSGDADAGAGGGLYLIGHPLVQVKLARLRDATTPPAEFRRVTRELAALLFFSLTDDLPVVETEVQTPLAGCVGYGLARPLVLAPILRAGLGLLEGIHDLVPEAAIAHIGIYRDEGTLQAHRYYARVPAGGLADADVIVLDPMLATGHTAVDAVNALKSAGAQAVRFLCLVSCPQGLQTLTAAHPDVPIYTASVDSGLNELGYIVPGLGDAGDRYFGT